MFFLKSSDNVKNPKNKKEVIRNRHFSFSERIDRLRFEQILMFFVARRRKRKVKNDYSF